MGLKCVDNQSCDHESNDPRLKPRDAEQNRGKNPDSGHVFELLSGFLCHPTPAALTPAFSPSMSCTHHKVVASSHSALEHAGLITGVCAAFESCSLIR